MPERWDVRGPAGVGASQILEVAGGAFVNRGEDRKMRRKADLVAAAVNQTRERGPAV